MQIIWQPKIALIFFLLIFFIIYFFYLSGEKKYKKDTFQTMAYFSGKTPSQNIKLQNIYWGFFEDFKKLYMFLAKIQKENSNDYIFLFILGSIIFLLALSL
ncbi:MAG: hypothetical protein GWO87_00960 [Xanthomonadaceae bacterium]|nr:hypothetical protein [Rhodospirillaceae bacterium]NIA17744.1 hypothetical protein [Xanthomonadaceae bacterium]